MSEEVQYEEVPLEDLHDHQIYQVNKDKEASSLEGGAAAVAAKGAYHTVPVVAKAISHPVKRIMGTSEPNIPQGQVTVTGAPPVEGKPIPTTVGEFHDPTMVSPHGFGPGAMKNTYHNVDMDVANELHSNLQTNPEPGFQFEGNRRILTPTGRSIPAAPQGQVPVTSAPPTAGASLPASAPLSPTERALQAIKGMSLEELSKKYPKFTEYLEKADPYLRTAGLFGAGTTGMEAMKRFKHGDYGRGVVDLIGTAGATAASLPVKNPWTTIGGAGVALSAEAINKLLDEYYGREYAAGGLATLR